MDLSIVCVFHHVVMFSNFTYSRSDTHCRLAAHDLGSHGASIGSFARVAKRVSHSGVVAVGRRGAFICIGYDVCVCVCIHLTIMSSAALAKRLNDGGKLFLCGVLSMRQLHFSC